jgi:hypothetical protein
MRRRRRRITETFEEFDRRKRLEELFRELEERLEKDIEDIRNRTAKEYVPKLCKALIKQNPDATPAEIRLRVIHRMCPKVWSESIVRKYWPDWLVEASRKERQK